MTGDNIAFTHFNTETMEIIILFTNECHSSYKILETNGNYDTAIKNVRELCPYKVELTNLEEVANCIRWASANSNKVWFFDVVWDCLRFKFAEDATYFKMVWG